MATNKKQEGKLLSVTLAAATLSGELVIQGKMVGVAQGDGESGDVIAIDTDGVFELPKVAADDIAAGATVYAKADKTITTTASGNTKCGYATKAAGNGTAVVDVKLFAVV